MGWVGEKGDAKEKQGMKRTLSARGCQDIQKKVKGYTERHRWTDRLVGS